MSLLGLWGPSSRLSSGRLVETVKFPVWGFHLKPKMWGQKYGGPVGSQISHIPKCGSGSSRYQNVIDSYYVKCLYH